MPGTVGHPHAPDLPARERKATPRPYEFQPGAVYLGDPQVVMISAVEHARFGSGR